jgi:hypothetical protein
MARNFWRWFAIHRQTLTATANGKPSANSRLLITDI